MLIIFQFTYKIRYFQPFYTLLISTPQVEVSHSFQFQLLTFFFSCFLWSVTNWFLITPILPLLCAICRGFVTTFAIGILIVFRTFSQPLHSPFSKSSLNFLQEKLFDFLVCFYPQKLSTFTWKIFNFALWTVRLSCC